MSALPEIIALLRHDEPDLTARDVADILWLAMQTARRLEPPREEKEAKHETIIGDRSKEQRPGEVAKKPDKQDKPIQSDSGGGQSAAQTGVAEPVVPIHHERPRRTGAAASVAGSGSTIRIPAPAALPEARALGRALRPLKRRAPSRTRMVLDDLATAERSAEAASAGLSFPIVVFRPAPSRWLDIALVIDDAASMAIWQTTVKELKTFLRGHGAFRDVRVHYVATDDPKRLALEVGATPKLRRPCSARELVDVQGRRLILIVSDCVGRAWDNGEMAALIAEWGQSDPVALIQVLPPRLWLRTGLGSATAVSLQSPSRGTPNARLEAELVVEELWPPPLDGPKLPVASLDPASLENLARFLAGAGGARTRGFLLEAHPEPVADHATSAHGNAIDPEKRVLSFRKSATVTARRLAALLAAAAPLSLPVMRLVQSTMLPDATLGNLAEIFFGGILFEDVTEGAPSDAEDARYEFYEGTREILLESATIDDAAKVFRQVSEYVSKKLGQPRTFGALIASLEAKDGTPIPKSDRPFAEIHAMLLRRLGGEHAQVAARIEQRLSGKPAQPGKGEIVEDLGPDAIARIRREIEAVNQRPASAGGTSTNPVGSELRRVDIRIVERGDEMRLEMWSGSTRVFEEVMHALPALADFTRRVEGAARKGAPLSEEDLGIGQSSLFDLPNLTKWIATLEIGGNARVSSPVLVRVVCDAQHVLGYAWEALPRADGNFLGTDLRVVLARGVMGSAPLVSREVRGAARILAISPPGSEKYVADLQSALGASIAAGEIEWVESPTGNSSLSPSEAIGRHTSRELHVLHVVAPRPDDIRELLAMQLRQTFERSLRLIVLEHVEDGPAPDLGAAAHALLRGGVDAVVALPSRLRPATRKLFFEAFYRSLTGANQLVGDVGASITLARRILLPVGAEALSPVLYLRTLDAALFDYRIRKVEPIEARPAKDERPRNLPPQLERVLTNSFSLILGDPMTGSSRTTEKSRFRAALEQRFLEMQMPNIHDRPLQTLAQWFAMYFGATELLELFQKTSREDARRDPPPFIEAIASRMRPGVHISASWFPWLELAIARRRPDWTVRVVMAPSWAQGDRQPRHFCRRPFASRWEEEPPGSQDANELVVLRPFGGYSPNGVLVAPCLTEEDHDQNAFYLDEGTTEFLPLLSFKPVLLDGISMLHPPHYRLLRWAFGELRRRFSGRNVVAMSSSALEQAVWRAQEVEVIPGSLGELASQSAAGTTEGRS